MGPGIAAELADEALKMAPARRNNPRGCVHHSGHGAQYASLPPSKTVRERGARPSMGSISSPCVFRQVKIDKYVCRISTPSC